MPSLAGIGPLGLPELLIILVVIVIIFGVGKLPQIGGALGQGIREFRHSSKDPEDEERARMEQLQQSQLQSLHVVTSRFSEYPGRTSTGDDKSDAGRSEVHSNGRAASRWVEHRADALAVIPASPIPNRGSIR